MSFPLKLFVCGGRICKCYLNSIYFLVRENFKNLASSTEDDGDDDDNDMKMDDMEDSMGVVKEEIIGEHFKIQIRNHILSKYSYIFRLF